MGVSGDAASHFGNRALRWGAETPSSGSDCQRSIVILQIIYLVVDYLSWIAQSTIKRGSELTKDTACEAGGPQLVVGPRGWRKIAIGLNDRVVSAIAVIGSYRAPNLTPATRHRMLKAEWPEDGVTLCTQTPRHSNRCSTRQTPCHRGFLRRRTRPERDYRLRPGEGPRSNGAHTFSITTDAEPA